MLLKKIWLEISSQFQERISTGYYLPAGKSLTLEITSGDFEGWNVRIGAHTDDLSQLSSIPRWPCVTTLKKISSKQMSVSSPFGGLIYFESAKAGVGDIAVNLSDVVESPFIDLTQPGTINDWSRRRNAAGLWYLWIYLFSFDSWKV